LTLERLICVFRTVSEIELAEDRSRRWSAQRGAARALGGVPEGRLRASSF